jgi:DNA-binding transcriptional ArsR family regulator
VKPTRPLLTDPAVLEALAHPVRLDVLSYLMADGPATASVCARAVRDTPSNCSYHLRVLSRHGLVERGASDDGRERPWKATITGFDLERSPGDRADGGAVGEAGAGADTAAAAAALMAASLQLDQRLVRDYVTHRDRVSSRWRASDAYATYVLRLTPAELRDLVERLDELIRPLIAATRDQAPPEAELVHLGLQAFPRSWPR